MKYGLSEKQLEEVIARIGTYREVETAVLFGSRAIDTFKEASDVDIALKGEQVTASLAAKLKFDFEEDSYLPFFFDFIAYPTITNDALRQHIDEKGIVIYRRGMGEWEVYKLSEFVDLGKEQFKPTQNADFIYIGLEHIEQEKLRLNSVGHSSEVMSNKFLFKSGDILFGKLRPYFRKVIKPKFDGVCSTDIWVVRAKTNFFQDFVFYFLANWEFINTANVSEGGSRMPRADWNFLKNTVWSIPEYDEQKAIAAVLSSLDDKIDLLHRQNKTLEAMAETLFRQWFVVEAGEDWSHGTLAELTEFNYGKTLRAHERSGDGFPVYGSNGIVGYHKEYLIEAPGIITGRKGTLGVINYSFHNFFPIDTTFYITSKKKSEGLTFEYFLLKTLKLDEMNTDSAVPGLNRNLAHSIQIKIPPTHLIEQFNRKVKRLFEKININQKQIQTLESLRDTLLPRLMSGEVRVNCHGLS